jgi:hypothetical protein
MKGNTLILKDLKKNSEWCDKDRVLLYACFQILVDFIEKERPQTIVDYKHDPEHRRQWKELQAIYRYWKKDRPRLERESDKALMKAGLEMVDKPGSIIGRASQEIQITVKDKKAHRLHDRLYDKLHRLDDEMLQRIINIRHHLWC